MNIVMKNLVTQTMLWIRNISAYKRIPKTSEYKDLCLVLSICDGLIHGGGGGGGVYILYGWHLMFVNNINIYCTCTYILYCTRKEIQNTVYNT
jgi:hypothetical protein